MLGCGLSGFIVKFTMLTIHYSFFPYRKWNSLKLYKGGANGVSPIQADCTTSILGINLLLCIVMLLYFL